MRSAIIALTKPGKELGKRIYSIISTSMECHLYLPERLCAGDEQPFSNGLKELIASIFHQYNGLIFIMAMGIVVRVIAPLLKDKRSDPAVVTIDEKGVYVISVLSGHLGGANRLAQRLAHHLGSQAVITTATDCHGKVGIDLIAQRLGCALEPISMVKRVNGGLISGERIGIFADLDLPFDLDLPSYSLDELGRVEVDIPILLTNQLVSIQEPHLFLRPKNIIVGIGCRRGVSKQEVLKAIETVLERANTSLLSVRELVTIDEKSGEVGLLEAAEALAVPLCSLSAEEIRECPYPYLPSTFVKNVMGVDGVCQPAAMLRAKEPALLCQKTIVGRATAAVVEDRSLLLEWGQDLWNV